MEEPNRMTLLFQLFNNYFDCGMIFQIYVVIFLNDMEKSSKHYLRKDVTSPQSLLLNKNDMIH